MGVACDTHGIVGELLAELCDRLLVCHLRLSQLVPLRQRCVPFPEGSRRAIRMQSGVERLWFNSEARCLCPHAGKRLDQGRQTENGEDPFRGNAIEQMFCDLLDAGLQPAGVGSRRTMRRPKEDWVIAQGPVDAGKNEIESWQAGLRGDAPESEPKGVIRRAVDEAVAGGKELLDLVVGNGFISVWRSLGTDTLERVGQDDIRRRLMTSKSRVGEGQEVVCGKMLQDKGLTGRVCVKARHDGGRTVDWRGMSRRGTAAPRRRMQDEGRGGELLSGEPLRLGCAVDEVEGPFICVDRNRIAILTAIDDCKMKLQLGALPGRRLGIEDGVGYVGATKVDRTSKGLHVGIWTSGMTGAGGD